MHFSYNLNCITISNNNNKCLLIKIYRKITSTSKLLLVTTCLNVQLIVSVGLFHQFLLQVSFIFIRLHGAKFQVFCANTMRAFWLTTLITFYPSNSIRKILLVLLSFSGRRNLHIHIHMKKVNFRCKK